MAPANALLLCLLVVVAAAPLLAQRDTVLPSMPTLEHDILKGDSVFQHTAASLRRNLLQTTCPPNPSGVGTGPSPAQVVTPRMRRCFVQVINREWRNGEALVPSLAAKLTRMFFHDIAGGRADGSLSLNSQETAAFQNLNIRGIEALQLFKDHIATTCSPSTISWADLLVLATAVGIFRSGGPEMTTNIPLGRSDSAEKDCCLNNIPSPFANATTQLSSYRAIFGTSFTDGEIVRLAVTLAGGHTLGTVACRAIGARLNGTADVIDQRLLSQLRTACAPATCPPPRVNLDPTQARFDNSYFKELVGRRGRLISDHELFAPGACAEGVCSTQIIVQYARNQAVFFHNFKWAFCKLSIIGTSLTCPPRIFFFKTK